MSIKLLCHSTPQNHRYHWHYVKDVNGLNFGLDMCEQGFKVRSKCDFKAQMYSQSQTFAFDVRTGVRFGWCEDILTVALYLRLNWVLGVFFSLNLCQLKGVWFGFLITLHSAFTFNAQNVPKFSQMNTNPEYKVSPRSFYRLPSGAY